MPQLDLSGILDQVNQFAGQAQQAGKQLFDLSAEAAVTASDDSQAALAAGVNNQVIDSAKQTAEFQTQNAKIKGATALGTNLKAQGEVLTGLSDSILDLISRKDAALKVVSAKQSVGLFDDPLQFIANAITLPDDIAKYNALNEEYTAKTSAVQTLNQLSQATVTTQGMLTESITEAGMAASADNTRLQAQTLANKSYREALGYNAKGITEALQSTKETLAMEFNGVQAQNAQTQIGVALSHLELSRQEFDFRKAQADIINATRGKETDTDQYVMDRVNNGLQRMGMAPIPQNSPRAGSILQLLKTNSPSGKLYAEAFQIANDSELAGGATILAPSPARAVELLNSVPGIKLSGPQLAVKDLLTNATQLVAQAAATPGSTIDLKNPASRNKAIDDTATALLAAQAKKVIPGDQTNVFNIPPLAALINASPEMQKLPVVAKVIAPAIAAGVDLTDPDKTFNIVAAALNQKKLSYSEALELTSVYARGAKVNIEARQLQSLGLNLNPRTPTDPSIYSYNVPITTDTTSTMFSGKSIIDLTKPDQVGRALNKWMSTSNNPFANNNAIIPR